MLGSSRLLLGRWWCALAAFPLFLSACASQGMQFKPVSRTSQDAVACDKSGQVPGTCARSGAFTICVGNEDVTSVKVRGVLTVPTDKDHCIVMNMWATNSGAQKVMVFPGSARLVTSTGQQYPCDNYRPVDSEVYPGAKQTWILWFCGMPELMKDIQGFTFYVDYYPPGFSKGTLKAEFDRIVR